MLDSSWTLKKRLMAGFLLVFSLGVLGWGIHYVWLHTPPAPPRTAQEAIATIGSARFQQMPQVRRDQYLDQAHQLLEAMPQDARRKLFESMRGNPKVRQAFMQMRMQEMTQRVLAFARADPATRQKMLDEDIDHMQQRMAQRQNRPAAPPGNPPGNRPGNRGNWRAHLPQHIDQHIQNGNPQMAGLMHEFHKAMMQRLQQRGITFPWRH